MKQVLAIGHRGAMGHEPENTLRSFQKALDLGVDMVELDVRMCRSGNIVVIHDQKLDRTTNGHGYVRKKELKDLKMFDAGQGERIPVFEEVLDLLDKRVKINIELKGKGTIKPVLRVIDRYVQSRGWTYDHFIVSSFTRKRVKKIAQMKPKIKVGALLAFRSIRFLKFAKSIDAYAVHINRKLLTKRLVQAAHDLEMQVYVWTVNEIEDIKEMIACGVDGIFSDYPERVKEVSN